ncbi:hypothetical protein YC2023_031429 [Brassica napus]
METNITSLDQKSGKDCKNKPVHARRREIGVLPDATFSYNFKTDYKSQTTLKITNTSRQTHPRSTYHDNTRQRYHLMMPSLSPPNLLTGTVTSVEPKAHVEQADRTKPRLWSSFIERERERRLSAQLETCLQPTQSITVSTTA